MWRSAVLAGIGCLALCTPARAADSVSFALFDADSGKGLVALSPSGLSFQFFGLRPSTRFRVVVSSKGCASSKGVLASKSFRTSPRGVVWDPVPVRATAVPRTAKIVRGAKVIGCAPMAQTDDEGDALKIGNASPAVVVVDQSASTWRAAMSISGLRKNASYQLVGLNGPCARTTPVVFNQAFAANRQGAALVDATAAAVPGSSIQSVAVVRGADQQVIFCKTV